MSDPKNMGRPKGTFKAKKVELIWVQADFVDVTKAFLASMRESAKKKTPS